MSIGNYQLSGRKSYRRVSALDLREKDVESEIEICSAAKYDTSSPEFFHVDQSVDDVEREYFVRSRNGLSVSTSASFLVTLPRGRILTNGFIVSDRRNFILSDSFRALGMLEKFGFKDVGNRVFKFDTGSNQYSPGVNVVLGAQNNRNYFHWLFESLPKIVILNALKMKDVKIIVPQMTSWMAEALAILGIESSRLIRLDVPILECESLVFPARGLSNIHTFAAHAIEFIDLWIERTWSRTALVRGKRLFVSREGANNRFVENELALFERLRHLGFVRIAPETFSLSEQVSIFRNAEFVVGALGAGLTNIAFMQRGSKVLELAPEGRTGDALLFSNLAGLRGLGYGCIVGPQTEEPSVPQHLRSFSISPTIFEHAIRSML